MSLEWSRIFPTATDGVESMDVDTSDDSDMGDEVRKMLKDLGYTQ